MIALLSYSTNSLGSDACCIHSTGGLDTIPTKDSVLISYDDLRIVNSKLVELKYIKAENNKLREIINTDSIIISQQKAVVVVEKEKNKRLKKQRNFAGGTAIGAILLLLISLL